MLLWVLVRSMSLCSVRVGPARSSFGDLEPRALPTKKRALFEIESDPRDRKTALEHVMFAGFEALAQGGSIVIDINRSRPSSAGPLMLSNRLRGGPLIAVPREGRRLLGWQMAATFGASAWTLEP